MRFFRIVSAMFVAVTFVGAALAADLRTGSGTVTEVIDVGTYTYLHLTEPDAWVATNHVQLAVGDKIEYQGGMVMTNFHSKSLDRTFDTIIFAHSASKAGEGGAEVAQAVEKTEMDSLMPKAAPAPAAGEIQPLAEGKTIAAIYAESDKLKDQTVSLRARVIKVSAGVLDKNWVTLQDGTGQMPDNQIMATSQELVEAGDLVVATGVLHGDIDIGVGYKYKLLLEETKFTKEQPKP